MSGAKPKASRRGARAVLCVALALAGAGVVAVVAGRASAPAEDAPGARPVTVRPVLATGIATPAATPSARRTGEAPPVVAARAPGDAGVSAGLERWETDSPSFDDGGWRERAAAMLARQGIDPATLSTGHAHLDAAGPASAGAPGPALAGTAAAGGEREGFEGWDGGKFWFGPHGLVRMEEATP